VWHINEPIYERVCGGETLTLEDKLFPITRQGYLEGAWFTLSYSPSGTRAARSQGCSSPSSRLPIACWPSASALRWRRG
jgi:hypothetical protein